MNSVGNIPSVINSSSDHTITNAKSVFPSSIHTPVFICIFIAEMKYVTT